MMSKRKFMIFFVLIVVFAMLSVTLLVSAVTISRNCEGRSGTSCSGWCRVGSTAAIKRIDPEVGAFFQRGDVGEDIEAAGGAKSYCGSKKYKDKGYKCLPTSIGGKKVSEECSPQKVGNNPTAKPLSYWDCRWVLWPTELDSMAKKEIGVTKCPANYVCAIPGSQKLELKPGDACGSGGVCAEKAKCPAHQAGDSTKYGIPTHRLTPDSNLYCPKDYICCKSEVKFCGQPYYSREQNSLKDGTTLYTALFTHKLTIDNNGKVTGTDTSKISSNCKPVFFDSTHVKYEGSYCVPGKSESSGSCYSVTSKDFATTGTCKSASVDLCKNAHMGTKVMISSSGALSRIFRRSNQLICEGPGNGHLGNLLSACHSNPSSLPDQCWWRAKSCTLNMYGIDWCSAMVPYDSCLGVMKQYKFVCPPGQVIPDAVLDDITFKAKNPADYCCTPGITGCDTKYNDMICTTIMHYAKNKPMWSAVKGYFIDPEKKEQIKTCKHGRSAADQTALDQFYIYVA